MLFGMMKMINDKEFRQKCREVQQWKITDHVLIAIGFSTNVNSANLLKNIEIY